MEKSFENFEVCRPRYASGESLRLRSERSNYVVSIKKSYSKMLIILDMFNFKYTEIFLTDQIFVCNNPGSSITTIHSRNRSKEKFPLMTDRIWKIPLFVRNKWYFCGMKKKQWKSLSQKLSMWWCTMLKRPTNNSAKAMVLREISSPPRRNRGPEDKCVYVLFPVSLKETLLIRSVT